MQLPKISDALSSQSSENSSGAFIARAHHTPEGAPPDCALSGFTTLCCAPQHLPSYCPASPGRVRQDTQLRWINPDRYIWCLSFLSFDDSMLNLNFCFIICGIQRKLKQFLKLLDHIFIGSSFLSGTGRKRCESTKPPNQRLIEGFS